MGAAVDVGVIREHVLGFLSMPSARRLRWRRIYVRRRRALFGLPDPRAPGVSYDFVGEFALGRDASATNWLRRSLIKSEVVAC